MEFNKCPELAEFLGILTGDGYMNEYQYGKRKYSIIDIAGHSQRDNSYLTNHVSELIKKLFKVSPLIIIRKDQNTMHLRLSSRDIFNLLLHSGFKKGKKGEIGIPGWILKNKKFMRFFIKGFFDTDGCLCLKKKYRNYPYYPTISLSSISKTLMISINQYLISKEFKTVFYSELKIDKRGYNPSKIFRIELNGEKQLRKWKEVINSDNPKHKEKF